MAIGTITDAGEAPVKPILTCGVRTFFPGIRFLETHGRMGAAAGFGSENRRVL
jgi:hypothetical protein